MKLNKIILFNYLYVESGVQQIGVVVQARIDEHLKLRVGEHLTPRQIAEACGVADGERVGCALNVAYESLGINLGTLVLIV